MIVSVTGAIKEAAGKVKPGTKVSLTKLSHPGTRIALATVNDVILPTKSSSYTSP